MLTRKEQFTLPFQSRIHSRAGRRFAFLLTSTTLPVATINTVVQWLVPPPKYPVQRLVPSVKMATGGAKLAGMFIIERGGTGDASLEPKEALEILLQNCEDAYGFPPYPAIKSFLHGSEEHDLRAEEQAIIAAAFTGCPTTLLRSTTLDWAQRIAALAQFSLPREEPHAVSAHVDGLGIKIPVDGITLGGAEAGNAVTANVA
jgi:hypothetical protein